MKKVKHWLHALLSVVTCGLWLPVYVIVIATTEMFNRGYREGKAAGRVEIAADPEWMRVSEYKGSGAYAVEPGSASVHIVARGGGSGGTFVDDAGLRVDASKIQFNITRAGRPITGEQIAEALRHNKDVTTFERFKELGDRMLSGDPLDQYEQLEYQELRKEVVR